MIINTTYLSMYLKPAMVVSNSFGGSTPYNKRDPCGGIITKPPSRQERLHWPFIDGTRIAARALFVGDVAGSDFII